MDINEQVLLGREVGPRKAEEGGAGGQDAGAAPAAGGGGEASRKRPRENDEEDGKIADGKEKEAEVEAPSKKARSEVGAEGKAPEPALDQAK